MFYVVNNHLNNLSLIRSNKAVGHGKISKIINIGPTSIPEARVFTKWNKFLWIWQAWNVVDFWPRIYLILYPSLWNLTTNVTIISRLKKLQQTVSIWRVWIQTWPYQTMPKISRNYLRLFKRPIHRVVTAWWSECYLKNKLHANFFQKPDVESYKTKQKLCS